MRRPHHPPGGAAPTRRRIPRPKRLEDFDFTANPAINPATIHQPAGCDWIRQRQHVFLIGDSGTGKSHLLIALGAAAAEHGYRVKYTLASKLVNELAEAADDRQLTRIIARYGRVDLLILDELGLPQPRPSRSWAALRSSHLETKKG
jgi:DNA replication protein DnaC